MHEAGDIPGRADDGDQRGASLRTDVLVIGSGPAGAAAARSLASRGHRVVLLDRAAFPRDKICGDALLPDALGALDRLGLGARVRERARALGAMRLYGPAGGHVALEARLLCLPRREFDETLRQAAVEAGARFLGACEPRAPIERDGAVAGALVVPSGQGARAIQAAQAAPAGPVRIEAAFTLLATGAAARPLQLFGMCERVGASAIAARTYLQVEPSLAARYPDPCISYDRDICPGYGWVFPGPHGRFNVGVGYFNDASAPPTTNLRELLSRFMAAFEPARTLAAGALHATEVRGAPLRTALCGARLARPGLMVIGEAAGLTYSFSGEGIGKAMESGLLAADIVSGALADGRGSTAADRAAVAHRYRQAIAEGFAERFRAYALAQRWLAHPRVIDYLVGRARAGRFVRRQMEGLVTETTDPRTLFSVGGLLRALVR